jgi:hypothetical protein
LAPLFASSQAARAAPLRQGFAALPAFYGSNDIDLAFDKAKSTSFQSQCIGKATTLCLGAI